MIQPFEKTGKTVSRSGKGAADRTPGFQRFQADAPAAATRIPPDEAGKLIVAALIGFILWLAFLPGVVALVNAEEEQSIVITKKQLRTAAYNSLWRLQRSMERDGYYSARVALNVWRSNAIDAGIFKQQEYEQYKRQIYDKSIESNQLCFEKSIEAVAYTDANKCLLTWKLHTEEIGIFDAARYEEMNDRLQSIKDQKPPEPES